MPNREKTQLKEWIAEKCIKRINIKWTDVVHQEFLDKSNDHVLMLGSKEFLRLYEGISELDEIIFDTYQSYCRSDKITLYCPVNPGHYWNKNDTSNFRREIFDFFVLYVMKLSTEQINNQISYFVEAYNELYCVDDMYQRFAKNSDKKRTYLLYLITTLFLYQNESSAYKKEKYKRAAYGFIELIKKDFFYEGQQIFGETFGMEFDDDVRICLLEMASEKNHLEASYELAEFYKFTISRGNTKYSWYDVVAIYQRIEGIDESGRSSWALGRIAEKGYATGKIDYMSAKRYYEKAIRCGYSKAYNSLGNLYWKNNIAYDDKVKNIKDVIELYETAINKGNTYGYINLGHIFSSDKYECKNLRSAEDYYKKAGERNSELAKYFQAKLYFDNRSEFCEIDDFCLVNMFIKMTKYSSQFKYLGKVYEYLAKLLKQNGLLESEIRKNLDISINQGHLIDKLNEFAWQNGNHEVIYDLAMSVYNNEEITCLKRERAIYYLEYRNANNISCETKKKCDDLHEKLTKYSD